MRQEGRVIIYSTYSSHVASPEDMVTHLSPVASAYKSRPFQRDPDECRHDHFGKAHRFRRRGQRGSQYKVKALFYCLNHVLARLRKSDLDREAVS